MTDTSGLTPVSATPPITQAAPVNDIDVVALLKKGVQNVQAGISKAIDNISELGGKAQSDAAAGVAATKSEADAQSQIATIKATRDLQLQADNKGSQAAMGTLPGDASYIAANIRDNVLPKQQQIQKDQDELEGMKKVGLFDDPIQHVVNAFLIPFKEKSLLQEQADVDQRLGVSTKIQSLSDQVIAANNATDQVDATAMAKATSQAAYAQAAIKANEIQDRATSLGIEATNVAMSANVQSLDISFKYTSALFQQNKDNYERLQADANAAYRDAAAAADRERVKIESENQEDRQSAFTNIQQVALAKFGIKLNNIQDYKNLGKEQQDILSSAAGSATLTNGVDVISPTKSMEMLQKLGTNGPSPGVAYVFNKLKDMSNPVDTNPAYLTLDPNKKTPLKDAQIQSMVQAEAQNIPSREGIYSPLTFDRTANINPVIASLPLVKEMVAGGLGKVPNTDPTNPDDFIATGLNQIKRGVPIKDVAAQIATVFQTVSTNLNDVRRYSLLNVPGLAPDQPYKMSVHIPSPLRNMIGVSGLPPILDMNSPAAVQNYLTRMAAAQREFDATQGLGFGVHQ